MKFLFVLFFVVVFVIIVLFVFVQMVEMILLEMVLCVVGKDGMVCGKVEKVCYVEGFEGQLIFLYMGGVFLCYIFLVCIVGVNCSKFSFLLEILEGKIVCVIGKIVCDVLCVEIEVSLLVGLKFVNIK